MKKVFFILLLLVPKIIFGQALVPFGGTKTTDTAYAARSLRVDSVLRFLKYANSDTTKVLTTDATGKVTLRGVIAQAVISVSVAATGGITAAVTNPTTTPTITMSLTPVNLSPGSIGSASVTIVETVTATGQVTSATVTPISLGPTQVASVMYTFGNTPASAIRYGTTNSEPLSVQVNGVTNDSIALNGTRYLTFNNGVVTPTVSVTGLSAVHTYSNNGTGGLQTGWRFRNNNLGTGSINDTVFNWYASGSTLAFGMTDDGIVRFPNKVMMNANGASQSLSVGGAVQAATFIATGGGSSTFTNGSGGYFPVITVNQNSLAGGGSILLLESLASKVDSFDNAGNFVDLEKATIIGHTLIGSASDDGSNALQVTGNIKLESAGNKLNIATGSNAAVGTATLSSGVIAVSNTSVTANSIIDVHYKPGTPSTITSILIVTAISAGSSFTVTAYTPGTVSTATTDNNLIEYSIKN